MKNLFIGIALALVGTSASALDIAFRGGTVYRSPYQEGIGRSSIVMTGNPGYVMIATDQNRCNDGLCGAVGIGSDVYSMLYRLEKVAEVNEVVRYEAILVPFTELATRALRTGLEQETSQIKITLEADISWPASHGGNDIWRTPKMIKMTVGKVGASPRQYELKPAGGI